MTAPADGTLRLHNRLYKTVALRVQEFRDKHPIGEGWAIRAELLTSTPEAVLFRAVIVDPTGREVATGYAEEKRSRKGINATSALENCETSAIGRALAAAGWCGTEYATAEELHRALQNASPADPAPAPAAETTPAAPAAETAPARNHHPSWTQEHRAFIADLKALGLAYGAVADFCDGKTWGRPATWDGAERARFLKGLRQGDIPQLYKPPARQPAPERQPWAQQRPAYHAALRVHGIEPDDLDAYLSHNASPVLDEQTPEQREQTLEWMGRRGGAAAVQAWLAQRQQAAAEGALDGAA